MVVTLQEQGAGTERRVAQVGLDPEAKAAGEASKWHRERGLAQQEGGAVEAGRRARAVLEPARAVGGKGIASAAAVGTVAVELEA